VPLSSRDFCRAFVPTPATSTSTIAAGSRLRPRNLFNFLVNRETFQGIIEDNPRRRPSVRSTPRLLHQPARDPARDHHRLIDARLQNLSVVRQSGLDVDIGYRFALAGGRGEVGATGTYIFNIDQA
jgi:hypothetical protein